MAFSSRVLKNPLANEFKLFHFLTKSSKEHDTTAKQSRIISCDEYNTAHNKAIQYMIILSVNNKNNKEYTMDHDGT